MTKKMTNARILYFGAVAKPLEPLAFNYLKPASIPGLVICF